MRKYLVILFVAAFAFLAMPAMAQAPAAPAPEKTVTFYGQIWWDAFYEKDDKNVAGGSPYRDQSTSQVYYNKKQTKYEATDFSWGLNPIVTRLGANFKQDNLTGKFEIRPFGDGGNNNIPGFPKFSSLLREAWAQYEFSDFAGIKVLVGQTYCPLYAPIYMMAQGGMNKWAGDMRPEDRTPMVQVSVPTGAIGTVKLALIQPSQKAITADADAAASSTANLTTGVVTTTAAAPYFNYYENPFPKVEAAYNFKMKAELFSVNVTAGAGYNQESAIRQETKKKVTVASYVAGASGIFGIGPAELRGSYHFSRNGVEFSDSDDVLAATYTSATDTLNNTDANGFHAVANVKFGMFQPYVGYGKMTAEGKLKNGTTKVKTWATFSYVGCVIKPMPSLVIQPEFAVKDNGKTKTGATEVKNGKERYCGIETVIFL